MSDVALPFPPSEQVAHLRLELPETRVESVVFGWLAVHTVELLCEMMVQPVYEPFKQLIYNTLIESNCTDAELQAKLNLPMRWIRSALGQLSRQKCIELQDSGHWQANRNRPLAESTRTIIKRHRFFVYETGVQSQPYLFLQIPPGITFPGSSADQPWSFHISNFEQIMQKSAGDKRRINFPESAIRVVGPSPTRLESAVTHRLEVVAVMIVTGGEQLSVYGLDPNVWKLALNQPLMQIQKSEPLGQSLGQVLPQPDRVGWTAAWEKVRHSLTLPPAALGDYQEVATGPQIKIKLPASIIERLKLQKRTNSIWLLAGTGRFRRAAQALLTTN